MRLLALDTTTRDGSAALVVDDRIAVERRGDPSRTHAERLPAEILALLTDQRVTLADIDLFAVSSGPGSFTGLRIGIATMQGLALVAGKPMVGVSALDALAHTASATRETGERIGAVMDAHRGEVFAALFELADARRPQFDLGRLREIEGPTVGDPRTVLTRWFELGRVTVLVGDGVVRFADVIAREYRSARCVPPPLLAGAIGRLALTRSARGGAVHPAGVQPLYIRRPDAEIARENSQCGESSR